MSKFKAEQLQAINHDSGNLLVSASAGSGKTTVMIERLIRVISSGRADVNSVLAVTFTEAAASDMKEKLKKALIKSVSLGNENLAKYLPEVATADICTLHSFCGKIIRTYFFEVGVSPDYQIADENKSEVLKKECIDRVFSEYYANGDQKFLELASKLSVRRKNEEFKKIILKLFEFFGGEANPIEKAKSFLDSSLDRFNGLLKEYEESLFNQLIPLKEKILEDRVMLANDGLVKGEAFANGLLEVVEKLLSGGVYSVKDLKDFKVALNFDSKPSELGLQIKAELTDIRAHLTKIVDNYSKYVTDRDTDYKIFVETTLDAVKLVEILENFTKSYSKAKREENLLDFDDLEHYAFRILSNDEIRKSVKEKYKFVFVDEYQDVNGVQAALINLIANDNLFMVGDAKQSIYGFRGCNPEFFTEKAKNMPLNGQKTIYLNYNFRSADAIIKTVNSIFTYAMTESVYGESYLSSLLVSGGLYPQNATGRVQIHHLQKPPQNRKEKETPRIYDLLEEIKDNSNRNNASGVANLVADIINSELGKTYYDVKSEKEKKITYGDICILARKRENALVTRLVNGLIAQNVPVVSEVKQSIIAMPHLQTLINALRLIDNFSDDVALASTLKSGLGGFTDEDLAEMVIFYNEDKSNKYGTFSDAYAYCISNLDGELGKKLKDFDERFNKLRVLADFCGAYEILKRIIEKTDFIAQILAESRGEYKLKCLNKFLEVANPQDKRLTVSELIALVDADSKQFYLSPDIDEDNVRVMTMHASKGLEFPVVIVCGLEEKITGKDKSVACMTDRNYGLALKHFDLKTKISSETLLRGVIKRKMAENGFKEELRLFYVATTRATYSMHLIYQTTDGEKRNPLHLADSLVDFIPTALPVTSHSYEESDCAVQERIRKVLVGKSDQEVKAQILKDVNYSYPFKEQTTLPIKTSVTAQMELAEWQEGELEHLSDGGRTDIERGIIAHKIMEHLDFKSDLSVYEQTLNMIEQGVISKQDADKVQIDRLENAVKNPLLSFTKNATLYTEKSFISGVDSKLAVGVDTSEKVLIQGVIDLLAIVGEGAYIVDYKYSTLTAPSLKLKYEKQLKVYESALSNATGVKVLGKFILNFYTGEVVQID